MHVRESGEVALPAILFLHSSPLSGRMWAPQMESLVDFHCLAPDLPGHGMSAGLGDVSVDDTIHQLADLILAKAPSGRAHVVGHSYGGVIAQALVSAVPGVVDRVLLSGSSAPLDPRMQYAMAWYIRINQVFMRLMKPEKLAKLLAWQYDIPEAYTFAMQEEIARVSPKTMANILLRTYTDIRTPTRTTNPVLVAVGEKETSFARIMALRLVRMIPGSKGVVIPDVGHIWNLESPDLFTGVARSWFLKGTLPQGLALLKKTDRI